jgi:hypothetical protein
LRRSYFDVLDGDGSTCDDTGLEFESLDAAEYMAAQAAAEIGRDRLSAGDAREVTITVGSVANPDIGHTRTRIDLRSAGRAEERGNEVALSAHVIRWCTDNLSLPDHRHGLVARNRP